MPLNLDYDIYSGVSVITVKAKRDTPEIKTTNYYSCLNAYQLAQEHQCFDAILMDEDQMVLEGSRSNIFWVKGDCLLQKKLASFQESLEKQLFCILPTLLNTVN